VSYFFTFGCVAHVKQGSKHLGKLEDRNTMMVFIGYEPGSKAWRFYNPMMRRIHVSRDAVFEEDRAWEWCAKGVEDGEPFQVEYVTAGGLHVGEGQTTWPEPLPHEPVVNSSVRSSPRSVAMPMCGSEPRTPLVLELPGAAEHVSPPDDTHDIDEEADGAPLHFRTMADLLGTAPQQGATDTQLRE
jgi:hypothetical protein